MKNLFTLLFLLASNSFVLRVCYASPNADRGHYLYAPANDQPLANVAIQKAVVALQESAYITVNPVLLGLAVKDILIHS